MGGWVRATFLLACVACAPDAIPSAPPRPPPEGFVRLPDRSHQAAFELVDKKEHLAFARLMHRLDPEHPAYGYNAAAAALAGGHCEESAWLLRAAERKCASGCRLREHIRKLTDRYDTRCRGRLRVRVEPSDAEVWVEGARGARRTSGRDTLVLAPGSYRVVAAAPGHTIGATQVEVARGAERTAMVRLAALRTEAPRVSVAAARTEPAIETPKSEPERTTAPAGMVEIR